MRIAWLGVLLAACTPDRANDFTEPPPPLEQPPLFEGPFVYDHADSDGVWLLDTLWIVTEQAVEEMADLGQTPNEFLDWRIGAINETLERSLIDSSRLRSAGVHELVDDDYVRTGVYVGDTAVNISQALGWLGTYREVYGADKVAIVAGTQEGASGAALGGGDVSAYWVDFMPFEHEFGHQMGALHCNEGTEGELWFGYPAGGYTDEGVPVEDSPVAAGTRMCGNSIALFSNPDVRLTLEEVEAMVSAGLAPEGDWAQLVEDDGRIAMGDARYANMAAQWRTVEQAVAEKLPTTRYEGAADVPYDEPGCVALYTEEGYGGVAQVVCAPDTVQDLDDVSSVQVGAEAHVNLYTDGDFGAGSMCGGQVVRLASSSPSLEAFSAHHGVPSLDNAVASAVVYPPTDRDMHAYTESPYRFYGNGASPACLGEALRVMPDNRAWSATAAVYQTPVPVPFAVDVTVTSAHEGETPPADALTFFFAKAADSYEVAPITREQLGVAADGTGYAVELNVWTNTVSVRDGDWNVVGEALRFDTFTDGRAVPLRIEVHASEVVVFWDGEELHRAQVAIDDTHDTVGFTSATGLYTIEYQLEDIVYSAL